MTILHLLGIVFTESDSTLPENRKDSPVEEYLTAETVIAARDGDAEAFGQLYVHSRSAVINFLVGYGFKHCEAEDLCHDIFIHVSRKLSQLKDPKRFLAWLIAVAKHKAINSFCRHKQVQLSESILEVHSRNGAIREARRHKEGELTRVGVRSLRRIDREALLAHYWDGNSVLEMSERFDIPVGTAKRRLHTARLRLGNLLRETGYFGR